MKLSTETLKILKNFSDINSSIIIKKGNVIRTVARTKSILADVTVQETFPIDFAIYDLNEFLQGIDLCRNMNPELNFTSEKYVTIVANKHNIKYFYADPLTINVPEVKPIKLPSTDVSVVISEENLEILKKASKIYDLDTLSTVGDATNIDLVLHDSKNPTSNQYRINIGTTDKEFSFNSKIADLTILPGEYHVDISSKLLARFTNKPLNLVYWVPLEPDSTYTE
jgi:hypothetical protein